MRVCVYVCPFVHEYVCVCVVFARACVCVCVIHEFNSIGEIMLNKIAYDAILPCYVCII